MRTPPAARARRMLELGIDALNLHWSDVTLEGANTSFQFHYRVDPVDFRDAFNAAQLVTPGGAAWWQETKGFFPPRMVKALDARVAEGGLPDLREYFRERPASSG